MKLPGKHGPPQIYNCSCGKIGVHNHGLKFTHPIEGIVTVKGKTYEAILTGRSNPTWQLREIHTTP